MNTLIEISDLLWGYALGILEVLQFFKWQDNHVKLVVGLNAFLKKGKEDIVVTWVGTKPIINPWPETWKYFILDGSILKSGPGH